jgi:hypothetical protein
MERGAAFKGRAKAIPKTAASRLDKSLFMALSFARALRCATEAEPSMNAAVKQKARQGDCGGRGRLPGKLFLAATNAPQIDAERQVVPDAARERIYQPHIHSPL